MSEITNRTGPVSLNGATVFDCGDYFRVVLEDGSRTTFRKSYNGFRTAGQLLAWLNAESLPGIPSGDTGLAAVEAPLSESDRGQEAIEFSVE